ncbi:hypothetical protein L6164_001257 [Bauhinia variegata]|uniref:Uncharacterized protein n=1 Tax=Bauhinia variegata TaxID=167791 RepID=A0ACB9Q949_BAUVA|nr:hypothetical protein L6164_001257 [Bauhinia variegata]
MPRCSTPLIFTVFVLLLLAAAETGPMVAEAKTCRSRSHHFKGLCKKSACVKTCQLEGSSGGRCRTFKCYCSKPCS